MKTLTNSLLLLFDPSRGWNAIARSQTSALGVLSTHTIPLALIPALCWYYGVTQQGWEIAGQTMRLTPASALPMCVLFFFAMIAGVVFLGAMVNWMSATYSAAPLDAQSEANTQTVVASQSTLSDGITLISYTATPFFIAGFLGLYPLLWVDLTIGTAVAAYSIYLLYLGVPATMKVPPERGFLYASAVFAVALVAFVALLGTTVVLWDLGAAPEYTY